MQTFSSFQTLPKAGGPDPMPFVCPTWLHGNPSCHFGCIVLQLVLVSGSVSAVPHVDVPLMCSWGGGELLGVLLFPHLDLSPRF